MDKRLTRILPRVQKPARYTGGEYGQIIKNRADVDIRMPPSANSPKRPEPLKLPPPPPLPPKLECPEKLPASASAGTAIIKIKSIVISAM